MINNPFGVHDTAAISSNKLKMTNSTSISSVQHPNAGRNIQQAWHHVTQMILGRY